MLQYKIIVLKNDSLHKMTYATIFNHIVCPTSYLSNCPTVQLSNCPTVQLSNCPTVQLSNYPTVQLSNYSTIQLSNYQTIQLSNPSIQTIKCKNEPPTEVVARVNVLLEKLVEDVSLGHEQVQQVLRLGGRTLVLFLLGNNILTKTLKSIRNLLLG